jgi:hypothetical protein
MTRGVNVVALATLPRPRAHVAKSLSDLGDEVIVDMVTWSPPPEPLDGLVRRLTVVGPPPGPRNIAVKIVHRLRGGLSRRYWAKLRADTAVLDLIDDADLVVALDTPSVWAGWHLARRPDVVVVVGAAAAARTLAARRP